MLGDAGVLCLYIKVLYRCVAGSMKNPRSVDSTHHPNGVIVLQTCIDCVT